ncbi:hypothetical protein L5515_004319 [Caenorhabditis briggsae]|uniref:Uncharacterized protein n=1 Tax=Caenorhabditis briggsae TaxID=6238 RepID=A0AAE9DCM6_CAEBR|nr:hypothetical protein L3Y34_001466 [Caenorhabditis briggsae]UMM23765.1 hypothetical protein L5515_004319 [Caenorhabditis briggsae]
MDYTCEAMRRMEQNQSSDTFHYHPYRQRKNSSTSTYSDCSSLSASPSSSTMTSTPPPQNCSANIYDRLKDYISEVPKDPIVCQVSERAFYSYLSSEKGNSLERNQTSFLPPCG